MTYPGERPPDVPGQPGNWTPNPPYPIQGDSGYPPAIPGQVAPQSPGPYPPPYAPLVRPTSGMATASLVFGIAGLFLFCLVIPSLVAVICGHEAIKVTKGGHQAGHGQAVAGLILGYVVMIPTAIWLVFGGFGAIMSAIEGS